MEFVLLSIDAFKELLMFQINIVMEISEVLPF